MLFLLGITYFPRQIHGKKLPDSGLGHNFRPECSSKLQPDLSIIAFCKLFSGIPVLPGFSDGTWHLAPEFASARCFVQGDMKGGQVGYLSKGLSKCERKESYLSKTPFLSFVYLSKFIINLPGIFGITKGRFL